MNLLQKALERMAGQRGIEKNSPRWRQYVGGSIRKVEQAKRQERKQNGTRN